MKFSFLFFPITLASLASIAQNTTPVYTSKAYTIYRDKVVQGKYTAKIISPTEITSDYQSLANEFVSPRISFKFSINGKDNEMSSGKDHQFTITTTNGTAETPLIKFGHQLTEPKAIKDDQYLKSGTKLKIRLDMREVLNAFNTQGFYIGANGEKIYKNEFKGVFVAGSTTPMIWDFNNLVNHPELQLKDEDGDGIYETTLTMNEARDQKSIASSWKLSHDISSLPQYHSGYKISDAVYNLSLDEMEKAIEPDSTFRTGKEWSGVWTRDISYSIILSMAVLQPKVAMYSLLRKVKNGRVIQDTGTGGAYPVSSDRMVWAVAAWEVYKVTGDKGWLHKAYEIIKNSVADDVLNVYDTTTGLVRGESSFLDWREETYPLWMQPADIYESECLGTNAVHYQVNKFLALMAGLMNEAEEAKKYEHQAARIRNGVQNYLWMPSKGYYGQYLYGRNYKILSPRAEALGEALSVLFDVADLNQQKSVVAQTPVNAFGIPCIYPQIPRILPYHNNAVWPFVESYWVLASAKAGNQESVLKGISDIYRATTMFLTNKENLVASNGDYAGTQINSSNMLWSLSGNIALIYKLLFGMHYYESSLQFKPFVPKAFRGERSLINYKYRNATLDITLYGYGNQIKTITIDGNPLANATIPANLTGKHTIAIRLANNIVDEKINVAPVYTSAQTPVVKYKNGLLSWNSISGASHYKLLKNGKAIANTTSLSTTVDSSRYSEYQVIVVDARGIESFASEPVEVVPAKAVTKVEVEDFYPKSNLSYQGYSGNGFVEISTTNNTTLNINTEVKESGKYVVSFGYSNGNGPINTENKCAIRTLNVNDQFAGTMVFPQRGKGEWSVWGLTNSVTIDLKKGKNTISLIYKTANVNMNGQVNQAMVDYLRIIKLN